MEQDFVMKTQQFWLHGKILSSSLNFSDLPLPSHNFNTISADVVFVFIYRGQFDEPQQHEVHNLWQRPGPVGQKLCSVLSRWILVQQLPHGEPHRHVRATRHHRIWKRPDCLASVERLELLPQDDRHEDPISFCVFMHTLTRWPLAPVDRVDTAVRYQQYVEKNMKWHFSLLTYSSVRMFWLNRLNASVPCVLVLRMMVLTSRCK